MNKRVFFATTAAIAAVGLALPLAAQSVPSPFRAELVATGLRSPKGLDMALHQAGVGPMGHDLFVAESGLDRIVRVDTETGLITPLAPTQPFPVGIACYGGPFAQYLYVGCAFGGGIERIAPDGTAEPFALAGMSIAGLDFGKGKLGGYLYAGEWTTGNVWRIDPDGNATLFASIPMTETRYVTCSNGGAFGTYVYFSDYLSGDVYRIAPDGTASLFASTGALCLEGLAFGPGGAFGKDLYVGDLCTGDLYRIASDGTVTLWATGFPGVADIEFRPGGAGGYVMFLVDGDSSVYRVMHVKNRKK